MYNIQFPMSEYVKDPTSALGWRTISHTPDRKLRDTYDTNNPNADAMMEDRDVEIGDVEPEEDE